MADFYVSLATGAAAGVGSFASPWNRLTGITGVTGGVDKVWVRRTTYVDTSIHVNWVPPSGVPVIGWPISTDEDYAGRPAAAQAAWDGDVGQYAVIDMTDASQNTTSARTIARITASSTLKRLNLIYRVTSANNIGYSHSCIALTSISNVVDLYNCVFQYLPSGTFTTSCSTQNGPLAVGEQNAALTGVFNLSARGSTFEHGVNVGSGLRSACLSGYFGGSAADSLSCEPGFSDCTFRLSTQATGEAWIAHGEFAWRLAANFVRCTFDNAVARSSTTEPLATYSLSAMNAGLPRPAFIDCTFTTVVSAAGRCSLTLARGRFIRCTATNFQRLYVGAEGQAHMLSFTQGAPDTAYAGAVETLVAGPSAVIDSLVLRAGNTRDIVVAPDSQAQVIVRNIVEGTGGYAPTTGNTCITLANINNVVGTWRVIRAEGVLETSAGSRVGGEAFSVVLKPSAAPNQVGRLIGLRSAPPGEDTVYVSLAAGSRTVTVFGYYGGYTVAPTKATVWVLIEYPTVSGLVTATTQATGTVTADASSWNIFSGGTAFKMAVTFTVPADCVGAVRVSTTAFDASTAYIAFDPKPVVV